jgi:hypothetical protein
MPFEVVEVDVIVGAVVVEGLFWLEDEPLELEPDEPVLLEVELLELEPDEPVLLEVELLELEPDEPVLFEFELLELEPDEPVLTELGGVDKPKFTTPILL